MASPTAWFDQFPGLTEDSVWDVHGHWCPRHWAPCPLLGYQGVTATRLLLQVYLKEHVPPNLTSRKAINRRLARAGYLCCVLGDDKMYELWGQCSPVRPVVS